MAKKWKAGYGTFEYEDDAGTVVIRYFRPGKAPKVVRVSGVLYRRSFKSFPDGQSVRENIHFVAHSLPPWEAGAPRYDKHGRALFASQKEVDDFVYKNKKAAEVGQSANAGGWEYVRDH